MDYQEMMRALAVETGMAEEKIYRTIQKTIEVYWENPSPEGKAERKKLGLGEEAPMPEELLTRVYLYVADSRNEETLC